MKTILDYFYEISAIPRGSGNMEGISNYIKNIAMKNQLEWEMDEAHNVLVRVPASPSKKDADTVMLQGHMDMVCVKTADSTRDFKTDPLTLIEEGDVLHADGTTLGADDGIAVTTMLKFMEDDTLVHPALELLFTADEEVGMVGARALNFTGIQAKYLINMDNGYESTFIVSCAGGARTICTLPFPVESFTGKTYELRIHTNKGGHSGAEIHKDRLNANMVLFRVLSEIRGKWAFRLVSMDGGLMENAIPTDAKALLISNEKPELQELFTGLEKELQTTEDAVKITLTDGAENTVSVIKQDRFTELLNFVTSLPNGVIRFSEQMPGLVETSLNLGILETAGENFVLRYNVRSNIDEKREALTDEITEKVQNHGGSVEIRNPYPGWAYRENSVLRDLCLKIYGEKYSSLSGRKPVAMALHAGLECGIIGGKYPNLDMISLGSDTPMVHSVGEKLVVSSFNRTFDFICDLLKEL